MISVAKRDSMYGWADLRNWFSNLKAPVILGLFVICSGCGESVRTSPVLHGPTMGTTYTIKLSGLPSGLVLTQVRAEVEAQLEQINDWMSTYRVDSEISRFNRAQKGEWIDVSEPTTQVVKMALALHRLTEGAFDPTVTPWVELWNFGPDPRRRRTPTQAEIDAAGQWVGAEQIAVRADPPALRKRAVGLKLDLSGIAKGFAVDCLAEILDRHGVKGYMIEIGGEIRTRGLNAKQRPWSIGIEAPQDDHRMIALVLRLRDSCLATSGDYRNFFVEDGKRYSHLIDPRTGRPVEHQLASVTVLDRSCARADALATAMMIMGADLASEFAESQNLAAMFLVRTDDGFVQRMTSRFEKETETKVDR
ncbi:MAG: FAD:protein FMN transferase [Pirellulaceae bacterium]|nr:FAD:protein FMN transferase [Pirellulaceae bacterium]